MADRFRGIEALGTDVHTVLYTMAAKNTERIIQLGQPSIGRTVATVREETIRLQQPGGTDEPVWVPPK